MLAARIIHVSRNRDDDYIAGIGTEMAQHTDENNNRGNQKLRRNSQNFFQRSINVAGAVSNTDTQGSNDYHAQRREAGIVGNHLA